MMRNVKTFRSEALMQDASFRRHVESFESELLRGISTLSILSIIEEYGTEGIYGYQLLKDLEQKASNMLIVEEGTLYPILRKFEQDGFLKKKKKYPILESGEKSSRARNHYYLTEEGAKLLNHMKGFFSKLIEAISPMMGFKIQLPKQKFLYCPNCSNKIDLLLDEEINFCNICGLNISGIKTEVMQNE